MSRVGISALVTTGILSTHAIVGAEWAWPQHACTPESVANCCPLKRAIRGDKVRVKAFSRITRQASHIAVAMKWLDYTVNLWKGFNWEETAPKQKQQHQQQQKRQSLCVRLGDVPEQRSGCLIVAERLHAQSLTLIDETQVPWVTRPGTVNHLQKSMKANYRCSHMTNISMSADVQVNYANCNGLEKALNKSHTACKQYRRRTTARIRWSCSEDTFQLVKL